MNTFGTFVSVGIICASTLSAAHASDPSSDLPGASDLRILTRPGNSFIIGAMHIDNDAYAIPIGPVERGESLGKSVTATGSIDLLAYAGPRTASSFTTYTALASQLTAAGYAEVWNCARKSCGSAFSLANILDKPVIASIHTGDWSQWMIACLNATNDDIRYGAFRKGQEYVLVMGALSPGYPSGALVVRVNGPANEPVITE